MRSLPELSELETRIMQILWRSDPCSAEQIRQGLEGQRELTDSSVRTLLRRLESKGYVDHVKDGKRFVYRPKTFRRAAASAAARRIVDRICGGRADSLLLGMLEDEVITAEELEEVRRKLKRREPKAHRNG